MQAGGVSTLKDNQNNIGSQPITPKTDNADEKILRHIYAVLPCPFSSPFLPYLPISNGANTCIPARVPCGYAGR